MSLRYPAFYREKLPNSEKVLITSVSENKGSSISRADALAQLSMLTEVEAEELSKLDWQLTQEANAGRKDWKDVVCVIQDWLEDHGIDREVFYNLVTVEK